MMERMQHDARCRGALIASAIALLQACGSVFHEAKWVIGGSAPEEYVMEAAGSATEGEGATVSLRSKGAAAGFGSAFSTLDAKGLVHRRVTISGDVQTRGVAPGAALALRVVHGATILVTATDDAMSGDSEWTSRSTTIAVPSDATQMEYGVILRGSGQVSVRNLRIAVGGPLSPAMSMGVEARQVLEAAIDIVKSHALKRPEIPWADVEIEARTLAGGAVETSDAYPAIRYLVARLGDPHSFVLPPAENAGRSAGENNPDPEVRSLDDRCGYLNMPGYFGTEPRAMRRYTKHLHRLIGHAVPGTACGWVLDLRQNQGGNIWPMLAALKPFLGAQNVGSFVDPAGTSSPWIAGAGVDVEPAAAPMGLETAWVAVLTGPQTADSGEAVAIAFRGRPHTRSFGAPTAGLSTANETFPLPDKGAIVLTVGVDVDRNGRRYGDSIEPDERVESGREQPAGSDAVLAAAEAWLTRVGGCGR
jgi:hypothetical protein